MGTQGGAASSLAASFYIAFIAVLGLLGAAVAHGLSHEWGESVGPRRLALRERVSKPRLRGARQAQGEMCPSCWTSVTSRAEQNAAPDEVVPLRKAGTTEKKTVALVLSLTAACGNH